jgi:hypothetical protein
MYVNPFWVGVVTTVLVEIGLLVVLCCVLGIKK